MLLKYELDDTTLPHCSEEAVHLVTSAVAAVTLDRTNTLLASRVNIDAWDTNCELTVKLDDAMLLHVTSGDVIEISVTKLLSRAALPVNVPATALLAAKFAVLNLIIVALLAVTLNDDTLLLHMMLQPVAMFPQKILFDKKAEPDNNRSPLEFNVAPGVLKEMTWAEPWTDRELQKTLLADALDAVRLLRASRKLTEPVGAVNDEAETDWARVDPLTVNDDPLMLQNVALEAVAFDRTVMFSATAFSIVTSLLRSA
jgi:hypothetical protein